MRDVSEVPVPAFAAFDFSKWRLPAPDFSSWAFSRSDLAKSDLALFDVPPQLIIPLLSYFRQLNTAADAIYYDVALFWLRLFTRGVVVTTSTATAPAAMQDRAAALEAAAKFLDLSALANPEGAILVIDAHHRPFVEKYDDVPRFLDRGLKFPSHSEAVSSPRDMRSGVPDCAMVWRRACREADADRAIRATESHQIRTRSCGVR